MQHGRLVVVHGHEQHTGLGPSGADRASRVDAAAGTETDVHHDDVGPNAACHSDGVLCGAGLSDEVDFGSGLGDETEPGTHERVIVDDRHRYGHCLRLLDGERRRHLSRSVHHRVGTPPLADGIVIGGVSWVRGRLTATQNPRSGSGRAVTKPPTSWAMAAIDDGPTPYRSGWPGSLPVPSSVISAIKWSVVVRNRTSQRVA